MFPSAWRRVSPLGNLISKSLVTRFSLQGGWMVEILTAAVSHSDGLGTLRRRTSLRSRLMLSCRSFISNRISRVGLHWSHSYSRIRNRESLVLGLPFTSIALSPVWFLCPSGEPMFCQLSLFWAIKWIWKKSFLGPPIHGSSWKTKKSGKRAAIIAAPSAKTPTKDAPNTKQEC